MSDSKAGEKQAMLHCCELVVSPPRLGVGIGELVVGGPEPVGTLL